MAPGPQFCDPSARTEPGRPPPRQGAAAKRPPAALQVQEQQLHLAEKGHLLSQLREQTVLLERRCSLLSAEEEELRGVLDHTHRSRKAAQQELAEAAETVHLLTAQVPSHARRGA